MIYQYFWRVRLAIIISEWGERQSGSQDDDGSFMRFSLEHSIFVCKSFGNGKNIYLQSKLMGFIADNMIYYKLD